MFAERLACELQTYFLSSLLSVQNFRRERSDNPKYVCSPQATEWWNRVEYNSYVLCKKLGVIRWLDCPCEIIWKLHFNSLSKQFLYVCFLPPAFLFFSFPIYAFFLFSPPYSPPCPSCHFRRPKCFAVDVLTKFSSHWSYCATRATVNTRQNFWHFFDIFLTSVMTGVISAGKLGGQPAIDLLCRFSFNSPFVK